MNKITAGGLLLSVLIISGCSRANGYDDYTAGDLRAKNHVKGVTISSFTVNGYRVPGLGGGYCCIMLPEKWTPDLKARIDWVVNPHTAPEFPGYKDRVKYKAWEDALLKSYQKYSTTVAIPQYGVDRCGLTVHFLPCHQVKVTTACVGYGTPDYPIKEPLNMTEPASCPVK